MKLPLSWLKEFVTIDASVDELSRRLTMAGIEVEGVEHIAPDFRRRLYREGTTRRTPS